MNLLYANDNPGEHAASWYAATADIPHYDSLTDSLDVDVCVIGAGYTGLSTALTLATKNISVCLLDAHRIGWGASGRNGGQLGSGFNRHDAITQSLGKPASQRYWALSERAKAFVLNTCQQYNINADYQVGIVSTLHRPVSTRQLFAAVESENQLHASANFVALDKQALQDHIRSEQYYGGVFDPNAGHLHPLKLAIGFAKAAAAEGALLFEQSAVNRIERANDGFKVHTAAGSVSAKNVVCAMNGYLDGLEPKARRDVIPINNFIVATEPLGARINNLLPSNAAIADSRYVVNYFRRSHDNRLLFGGGESYGYTFPKNFQNTVVKAMLDIFPSLHDVAIDYRWGGTLAITRSRWPSVHQLEPGLYSSSGYSGHGLALANFCGHAVANAISGDTEDFQLLSQLKTGWIPGNDALRPWLVSLAMGGSALLDRIPTFGGNRD